MFRYRLLIAAISFSFASQSLADGCKNKRCEFDKVNVPYCAGLQKSTANIDCKRKGNDVACKAIFSDGKQLVQTLTSESFQKVCGFTGDGTRSGQCSAYETKRENAAVMQSLYNHFFKSASIHLSDNAGCEAVNQCELFLKNDRELKRFATVLSNDNRIDSSEFNSIQAESNRLLSGLTAAALNGMDDSYRKVPYGPYMKIAASSLNENNEDSITFVKSVIGGYTTAIDDKARRTFRFQRKTTELGRSLTITDSLDNSTVELRYEGDKCFPYRASGGSRASFDFNDEAVSKENAYFKALQAYRSGKAVSPISQTAAVNKAN